MHEYKVVPAPQRAQKVKGLKTTEQRFANTLAEAINAEAAGGWQFLRTETLPCEERGTLGSMRTTTVTVMIFARELGQVRPKAATALAAVQEPATAPAETETAAAPSIAAAPLAAAHRREPVFRSGGLMREGQTRTEPVLRPRRNAEDGPEGDY